MLRTETHALESPWLWFTSGSDATPLATLVALHCVAFFALHFRNVAQESRYTP